METPLQPLHPQVPELLAELGLRVVDAIEWNVLACAPVDSNEMEPTVVLKFDSTQQKADNITYEVKIMSQILPALDQRQFERLVLPEYVSDGVHGGFRWMTMKFIQGQPLIHEWSEKSLKLDTLGGKRIPLVIAKDAVDVLRDLRSVDITSLSSVVRRFSFPEWLESFRLRSAELVTQGLLEQATVDRAMEIFVAKKTERYVGSMFTNGAFYPRNFIMLDNGKIAVVDWVGGVDPWEFVAMYTWMLMWGNAKWQVEYIAEIKRHFPVDIDEMQTGLLVKSFDQVYRWREQPEEIIGFARTQMLSYFRQSLIREYVRDIFA